MLALPRAELAISDAAAGFTQPTGRQSTKAAHELGGEPNVCLVARKPQTNHRLARCLSSLLVLRMRASHAFKQLSSGMSGFGGSSSIF